MPWYVFGWCHSKFVEFYAVPKLRCNRNRCMFILPNNVSMHCWCSTTRGLLSRYLSALLHWFLKTALTKVAISCLADTTSAYLQLMGEAEVCRGRGARPLGDTEAWGGVGADDGGRILSSYPSKILAPVCNVERENGPVPSSMGQLRVNSGLSNWQPTGGMWPTKG